jgi:lipid II:glycine glycyltransferase (peptidoglycan interpeptide bridge formation enzyme)
MRNNYFLDLSSSYQDLWKGFNENTRRNIKKAAKKRVTVNRLTTPDEIIQLFIKNKEKAVTGFNEKTYNLLRQICAEYGKKGDIKVLAAKLDGKTIAGGAFAWSDNRITYLFGSSTPEGKNTGAMHFLFNQIIETECGKNRILDFEGSDVAAVARFYAGFGAIKEEYPAWFRDKFPFLTFLKNSLKICLSLLKNHR